MLKSLPNLMNLAETCADLDNKFCTSLPAPLQARLRQARARPDTLSPLETSALILDLAPLLEDFLCQHFNITPPTPDRAQDNILACNRQFIQKRILRHPDRYTADPETLQTYLPHITNQTFSDAVLHWLAAPDAHKPQLDAASAYAAWALWTPEGHRHHRDDILFQVPRKEPHTTIPHLKEEHGTYQMSPEARMPRQGFDLTDPGPSHLEAMQHATYCLYCHNRGKDTCRTGLPTPSSHKGCPLDLKISEMTLLAATGHPLGALAIACIDNPLVAATGHRVCNDCMLSCIYQKQTPVNVPKIESRLLKEVLDLPWGVEIYHLLMHWNPLNFSMPLPKSASGAHVLVVGQGPAGFATAYHLLRLGHRVTAIDKMPQQPLDTTLLNTPIKTYADIHKPLTQRENIGFGGVMEYGITARWDKNYLRLIHLFLARNPLYTFYGNTPFDPKTADDFDHIAFCCGTGKPKTLPHARVPGMMSAAGFLMRLHNGTLEAIEGPVVIIGGGLTAVDAATEARALCGNATILYRRGLHASPSMTLNVDELAAAFKEGVILTEHTSLEEVHTGEDGTLTHLTVSQNGTRKTIPARTLLFALGTEMPEIDKNNPHVSYLGDMDPASAGSVVKALASGKKGAHQIDVRLRSKTPGVQAV